MKKIFVTLVLASGLFQASVMANNNDNVSDKLEKALHKEFAGAEAVKWEKLDKASIYNATFVYNEERISAFFDEDGQLIATGRSVLRSALPFLVTKTLDRQYGKYTVLDVIEYTSGDEVSYLANVDGADRRMLVQVYNDGRVSVLKKEKKSNNL